MEKTEILALIDKAIKGQGTNVDAGGALGTILDAIVDAIPEPVSPGITLDDVTVLCQYTFDPMEMPYENQTKEQICELLNLSETVLDEIMNGNYIRMFDGSIYYPFLEYGPIGFRTKELVVSYNMVEEIWTLSYPDSGE